LPKEPSFSIESIHIDSRFPISEVSCNLNILDLAIAFIFKNVNINLWKFRSAFWTNQYLF
jgi:hypothetical protein